MVFRLEVFLADGWIELLDVERDEAEVSFVFDRSEPVDYGCGVFPLVEAAFFRDCAVDAVEDLFADFAYTYIHTYIQPLFIHGKNVKAYKHVGSCTNKIHKHQKAIPWDA